MKDIAEKLAKNASIDTTQVWRNKKTGNLYRIACIVTAESWYSNGRLEYLYTRQDQDVPGFYTRDIKEFHEKFEIV